MSPEEQEVIEFLAHRMSVECTSCFGMLGACVREAMAAQVAEGTGYPDASAESALLRVPSTALGMAGGENLGVEKEDATLVNRASRAGNSNIFQRTQTTEKEPEPLESGSSTVWLSNEGTEKGFRLVQSRQEEPKRIMSQVSPPEPQTSANTSFRIVDELMRSTFGELWGRWTYVEEFDL